MLERRDAEEHRQQQAQRARGESFTDLLVGTVRRGVESAVLVQLFTKISAEATSPDHPSHAWFVARYDRLRHTLTEALRRELEHAEPVDPPVDPARAATALIGLMDGLQVQWLLDPDAVDLVSTVSDAVRRLGIPLEP